MKLLGKGQNVITVIPVVIVPLDRNDFARHGIVTRDFHAHTSEIESVRVWRNLSAIPRIDVVEKGTQQITHSECGVDWPLRCNYSIHFHFITPSIVIS